MSESESLPRLETNRLLLRPFAMSDCPRVAELAGDRRIHDTTLLIPHPYAIRDAEAWISRHVARWAAWREQASMDFAIVVRESMELVGAIGLSATPHHGFAEMGYWVGVPYWGRGYGKEAARALVGFAFDTLGMERLIAPVFRGNTASERVLQACGFQPEGVMRQHFVKGGRRVDATLFGLLRRDVRGQRGDG